MSNTYTVYLMVGVKLNPEEIGLDVWDDKWLPYTEGHQGVDIRILRSESSSDVYIGKVIAKWSKYDGDVFTEYVPESNDYLVVDNFLAKKLKYNKQSAKIMFFSTCN